MKPYPIQSTPFPDETSVDVDILIRELLEKLSWHKESPSLMSADQSVFQQSMVNLFEEYTERYSSGEMNDCDQVVIDATLNLRAALDDIYKMTITAVN